MEFTRLHNSRPNRDVRATTRADLTITLIDGDRGPALEVIMAAHLDMTEGQSRAVRRADPAFRFTDSSKRRLGQTESAA